MISLIPKYIMCVQISKKITEFSKISIQDDGPTTIPEDIFKYFYAQHPE